MFVQSSKAGAASSRRHAYPKRKRRKGHQLAQRPLKQSSGAVEGNVCRVIKALKRQMFGRAKLALLLRKRILLA